ncbi:hypothetical protein GW17_00051895 [Ensete ventricosum]|nr:hypothetical protein GW17_00051895 [Ensete ventricosum]
MPVLPLEELDLLAVVSSGAEVINRDATWSTPERGCGSSPRSESATLEAVAGSPVGGTLGRACPCRQRGRAFGDKVSLWGKITVVGAPGVGEDGDGVLLKGSLNFHYLQCRHKPLVDLPRCSSLVNSFGWEGQLIVDGVEGLCAANRVVTLVLRASWFSLSSCSHAKEIAVIIVEGRRALTSRIFGFNRSTKVPNNCFLDQCLVWLESLSNLV